MRWAAVGACGVGLLGVWALVAGAGDLRNGGLPGFAVLYFAAAAGYLGALGALRWALERGPPPRAALPALLALGLAFRLVLLPAEPSLSDDAWRYLWEGRVQLEGVSPYATAPDDPSLADLRDGVWLRVNHREVPAVYGPLLEAAFAGLALLGSGSLLPLKLLFLVADAVVALLLVGLLRRRGRSPLWVLAYAWHPLAVLEVAGQAHLELVPVGLLVGAVALEERGRRAGASLALGAAIAAKYLPLLAAPAFVLRAAGWRGRARRLALIALPGGLLALPYLGAGPGGGLATYAATFRFNDGGFLAADQALRGLGLSQAFCRHVLPRLPGVEVPPGFDPALHQTWMLILPKLLVAVVVLGVVAWTARPAVRRDPVRVAFAAGAVFLLFAPAVHPWYGLWIVPFLPLLARAGPGRAAWLTLSLVLPLAYAVLLAYDGTPGSWREAPWVRGLEYGPVALLLALEAARPLWSARDPGMAHSPAPSPTIGVGLDPEEIA